MSWSILGLNAPVSASSTLYVLSGTDFGGSQVRFHGTNLTYDSSTGFLNGGTVTSAEIFANGETVQTITMTGGLSGASFSNFWTPAASIKAQVATWGINNQSANSFAPNLIRYFLGDGTQVTLEGNGFSDFSNLGTVTAIKHYASDGVTLLSTVAGLPQPLGVVAAAFGGDKGFYHYVDQGMNTVTNLSTTQFLELDGGAGNDTIVGNQPAGVFLAVTYKQAAAGVIVDLVNQTATGGAGNDTLVNIHSVIGSTYNDTITGDSGDNFLFGDSGGDAISGGGGNDLISGGLGNNTINGGAGINTADYSWTSHGVTVNLGAAANQGVALDVVNEGFVDQLTNIQNVNGGSGNDHLTGNAQNNILFGDAGSDIFGVSLGNDTLDGGLEFDTADYSGFGAAVRVVVRGASGTVDKGAGNGIDTLVSIEKIVGSAFNDNFYVDGNESVDGSGGANTLYELSSNATIVLNSAQYQHIQIASLYTGVSGGTIDATATTEFVTLYGAASGATTLKTGAFGGWLIADGGSNTFVGGATAVPGHGDIFVGNNGTSSMTGGLGSNVYYVGSGDVVHGNLSALSNWEWALTDNLNINMATDGVTVVTLHGGTSSANAVGMSQFVTIYGGTTGTSTMQTGSGGGWMIGEGGTAVMTGHATANHTDIFVGGNNTASTMTGGSGINIFYIDGNDIVHGGGQVNHVVALTSGMSLTIGANFSNIQQIDLLGGTNTVNLTNQTGYIYVFGGAGNDTVIAGSGGNEIFTGRGGANTFKFANGFGTDAIQDWAAGAGNHIDFTSLAGLGVHTLADIQIATANGNTYITHVGHGSGTDALVLNGYTGGLNAGNFVFA